MCTRSSCAAYLGWRARWHRSPLRARTSLVALAVAITAAAGCDDRPPAPEVHGERWQAADALFDGDPRWVGGDGAYSVDLLDGRVLWLFGDTLVAQRPWDRDHAYFINNSAAIQHGADPLTSPIRFYWGVRDDGTPRALVPSPGSGTFLWPMHGARVADDALLLFYERVRTTGSGFLEFDTLGTAAFVVRNPQDEPPDWAFEPVPLPDLGARSLGEAAVVEPPWLYLYATTDDGDHPLSLARAPLDAAAAGDLSALEWWCGDAFCDGPGATILPMAAPELSVLRRGADGPWVMVHSLGFGATLLAVRTAPRPEGPWSQPGVALRPPESFERGAFVYAGKASAALSAATDDGSLVATYVEGGDYLPRFVRITLP